VTQTAALGTEPSATGTVGGGDLAYGLGDGRGVLRQDRTVVADDLRAHLDVRVAGGHLIEAGAYPFLPSPRLPTDVPEACREYSSKVQQ
jgi:hypothetical protein